MDLYKLSLGCYMYKNLFLVHIHSRTHDHNTGHREEPLVPVARLRSTELSVILNELALWNEIPADIRHSMTIEGFKIKFRKLLINEYSRNND